MLWFIYTTIKGNKLELIKEKSTFIYDGKGISKEELNLIVKHDYFLTVNGNYCNVRRDFDEVNVYRQDQWTIVGYTTSHCYFVEEISMAQYEGATVENMEI